MVEVQNVKKYYGEVHAVDGVSLTAKPGEIFGLIGPNGAGKSTIIRMIMNILAPDSGEIRIDGKAMKETDKTRIGYLPEQRGLYEKMAVNDVLLYFAALKGKKRIEVQADIDRWLERFDLADWKNKKTDALSKGMSQKIQFIASVVHDPSVIFLDEPFSGLDPVSVEILTDVIMEMGKEGKTILFSTHMMDQAEKLCTRIFLINKGKEVLSGTLDAIKKSYGNNFVQVEFDGDAEFLEHHSAIKSLSRFPRWVEIELAAGASSDTLLRDLVQRVSVRRFEVVAPSLHKIFVQEIGGMEGQE